MRLQIKNAEEYLASIIQEEEKAKQANKKGIYKINAKISDNVAKAVYAYYNDKPEYRVEIKKCRSCVGTWDIMIYFLY